MAYRSLYRKWRPGSFSDVVGQDHVVRTLSSGLRQQRIAHAYLFAGPRGTGKTSVARLLAKGLNCTAGPTDTPCGQCDSCSTVGQSSALSIIEIDGASNRGIDEIRDLREQARFLPAGGQYRVYIIDEVHMLTSEAFNALLKILEEPPAHVVFIFATTDPHKVPATILSRCQRYDFTRLAPALIVKRLEAVVAAEGFEASAGALWLLAEHAEGGLRDALSMVDQCLAYADHLAEDVVTTVLGVVSRRFVEDFWLAVAGQHRKQALAMIEELYQAGKDVAQFTRDLIRYLRSQLVADSIEYEQRTALLRAIDTFAQCEKDLRYAADARLYLELALLRYLDEAQAVDSLHERLARLEADLKRGHAAAAAAVNVNEADPDPDPDPAPDPAPDPQPEGSGQKTEQESAASAAAPPLLSTIQDGWKDYLELLRTEKLVQAEAFLREGQPWRLDNDVLIVVFPPERGFHKASVEQDKHRQPAEKILSRWCGAALTIQCALADEAEAPPTQQRPVEDESDDELPAAVTEALKMFGGKVVQVKGGQETEKGG